jgi:hydrogenase-4 component H
MGILGIVWRNFSRRSRTRLPADLPARPAPFRGLIEQDVGLCTGCRTCSYVCSSKAITFEAPKETGVTWNFFAGQCSFCGLCVQYCPTQAITNNGVLPPVTGDQTRLKVSHEINYHPCADCGQPIIPIPEAAMEQIYGSTLTDTESRQRELCPACRRRAMSRHILNGFMGNKDDHEAD